VQIARVDHWFKNAFMLLGVVLAFFYDPTLFSWSSVTLLGLAVLATCLIASSNYVLNELIDAPYDRLHPVKKSRPVPAGMIQPAGAVLEWLLLGMVGIALACLLNPYFAVAGIALWGMGVVYNMPPWRSKEVPYLDVLSESVNNPLRLFLGWFALVPDKVPPLSLTLAYWMVGAFLMAMKRLAEYRHIGNREVAAQYRKSFGYYTENRLLVGILYYAFAITSN
jgi:4-hydroxybenzoate polyprenyltransferase